jgi:PKD repeat protein
MEENPTTPPTSPENTSSEENVPTEQDVSAEANQVTGEKSKGSEETEKPEKAEEGEKKPELDPKTKRKMMLKRLGIVLGVLYLVVMLFIFAWAIFVGEKEIVTFKYLPFSQEGFGNTLFTLFNVFYAVLLAGLFGFSILKFFKFVLAKKDQVEQKKKNKRMTLIVGSVFFVMAILWIGAITFLGPRLVTDDRYNSGIITYPEVTVGLTAPIDIVFDASEAPIDKSTYQILSYTWNFGDGNIGNGEQVSHRYTQKGSADGLYTVTLNVDYEHLVTGEESNAQFVTEVGIQNELVAASFVASPDSGEVPLTVTFDASSSYDPDGEVIAYEWDFDEDGRYDDAEGVVVDHEFSQEGSFEVSLRVTDNNGDYNVMNMTIEAGSVNGLRAVISSGLAEGDYYYVGEKYSFDGSLSQVRDGKITSYLWDFGDLNQTQSRTASHTYEESGEYEVTLTIEDSEGNEDSTSMMIQVVDEGTPPTAVITATPDSGAVPLTVVFDASSSTDPDDDMVQYEWDFDNDGLIDDRGDKVTHTYEELGVYTAVLTVADSAGNLDETTQEITVGEQGIIAKLEADVSSGEVPLTVDFDASGSSYKEGNIVSYEYDFGDGNTYIGGSSVTYKYTSVGTFEASVTVVGDDGTKDTTAMQIVVRQVALTACFTVNTDSATAPLFLTVDPSCSEGTIKSYSWDFGDGELSFDRKPETHIYSEPGTYTVTLEVTSDEGIVDSFENTITVK